MQGQQSPVVLRSSADLNRMQALLAATGIPAPITTSPFSLKLDVAACYDQLNNSRNQRPEDTVMRQALELYCSLISPPLTPTPEFKSEQDQLLGQASEIFAYQDAFRPSSVIYEEPNYDPSADLNRPFGSALGQDYSSQHNHCAPQMDYTNYTPQAYSPQINYDHYRRSSHAISQHKATDSYSSQQRIHISGVPMTGHTESSYGMENAVSADEGSQGTYPRQLARQSFTVLMPRKTSPSNNAPIQISGPIPIDTSCSATPSGTFSVPVAHSRSLGGRRPSISLSPALEANEDLSPIHPPTSKPTLMRANSKLRSQLSLEDGNSIPFTRKEPIRQDSKSIWKTIKNTSRSSFAMERPMVQHVKY
ncbi:hypothetical protein PCASD_18548 [Puccinia coronata f. sp. avenae]|uniref:Uncharacterized protein n=1 Tax=Puccinia coronata f. sp. avenae TaxID=200324 RepID=A0A2N5U113_9BASI|nr:hypothetical protein PCASD_18548 [Puccinia coronata f. sp. avenae]